MTNKTIDSICNSLDRFALKVDIWGDDYVFPILKLNFREAARNYRQNTIKELSKQLGCDYSAEWDAFEAGLKIEAYKRFNAELKEKKDAFRAKWAGLSEEEIDWKFFEFSQKYESPRFQREWEKKLIAEMRVEVEDQKRYRMVAPAFNRGTPGQKEFDLYRVCRHRKLYKREYINRAIGQGHRMISRDKAWKEYLKASAQIRKECGLSR